MNELQAVPEKQPAAVGNAGVVFRDTEQLKDLARTISQSEDIARWRGKPKDAFLAIVSGMEVGMSPMQSLQQCYVIKGNVAIMGKAALALVRKSGELEYYDHKVNHDDSGNLTGCTVVTRRRGYAESVSTTYTVEQAKRAKLWMNKGPWVSDPDRMLYWRALGRNLDEQFGDILMGLPLREIAEDYTQHDRSPRVIDSEARPKTDEPDPLGEIIQEAPVQPPVAPEPDQADEPAEPPITATRYADLTALLTDRGWLPNAAQDRVQQALRVANPDLVGTDDITEEEYKIAHKFITDAFADEDGKGAEDGVE